VRVLVQRVQRASVTVGDAVVGGIGPGPGLCLFVGVTYGDTESVARQFAAKVWHLRIFEDGDGRINLSAADLGAPLLVVSQFTLYADTERGRRPSFTAAAAPELAEPLVDAMVDSLRELGATVSTGRFGAHMHVDLVNDGPFTLLLEQ